MSLTTWKAGISPCLRPCVETASPVDVIQNLNKWRGMRIENLTRHGCKSTTYRDISIQKGTCSASGSSCSLCQAYLGRGDDGSVLKIARCASSTTVGLRQPRGIDHTPPNPVSVGHVDDITDPEPMIGGSKTLRASKRSNPCLRYAHHFAKASRWYDPQMWVEQERRHVFELKSRNEVAVDGFNNYHRATAECRDHSAPTHLQSTMRRRLGQVGVMRRDTKRC